MPLVVKDRVRESSVTSGTGTITLTGAVLGFQTFSSAIGNTNTTYYTITEQNTANWEVGIGTVGAGTLTRDTVLESSNAGAKVNFGSAAKDVFCTYPAEKSVDIETPQTLTNKTINASQLVDGSITTAKIANNAITSAKMANGGAEFGMRNRIINGAMMIDQRNAGASVTPTATVYTLDRWRTQISQASKFSLQQNAGAVTPPVGFANYLGVTSLSAYSITSSDFFEIDQPIEGFNTADLAWGTASASTVTLSFWVRSSLTGTFGGALTNGSISYPFTYTVASANTWTQISLTIAGPTTGTWSTNNNSSFTVVFSLGMGSTRTSTAGSWQSGNFLSATAATSVVGTNGATFYITGVQLEKGSTATSFDYRPYGTELALCQRYYQTLTMISGYTGPGASLIQCSFPFNQMRAAPTLSQSGPFRFDDAAAGYTQSSVSVAINTVTNSGAQANFANITVGGNFRPYGKNDAQTLNLSAEL
jgi:hypothetical protein